jgi:hypothetical protein
MFASDPFRAARSIAPLLCVAICLVTGAIAAAADEAAANDLRMNQLQVIGTHNSYHVREKPIKSGRATEWNYSHAPLDVQLDRGVRSFELDLHWRGGEFFVFHVPILDEGSTCRTLADALATVRKWSEAHPKHVPISFLFELKKEGPGLDKRIKHVDAAGLDQLDGVLKAGFAEGQIITPDVVRGDSPTLREAVTTRGWPSVNDARGKVLFILHDEGAQRDLYTQEHPSLRQRVMFVRSDEKRDDGATLVLDNPRDPDIPRLAKAGYYIRTRADSSLHVEAPGQPDRRDAAFASGAHILSTDYPPGQPDAATGYVVQFENGAPARVNPVNGPEADRGKAFVE